MMRYTNQTTWAVAVRAGAMAGMVWLLCGNAFAQESKFATTNSRSQHVHWINLYGAGEQLIDPEDPNAPPYSPAATCSKCHEYDVISHGYHFNAMQAKVDPCRPGEPWVWVDERTGTQLPLSYRGWAGTYKPQALGITPWQFVLQFGRHLPGGGPGAGPVEKPDEEKPEDDEKADEDEKEPGRWKVAGRLDVDCMICHSAERSYNPDARLAQLTDENFAWAPSAAMGLAKIEGNTKSLPDDFDPAAKPADGDAGPRLPQTLYDKQKFNAAKEVFFDIVRKPPNNACYYCHTVRPAGEDAAPTWTHDDDVHLKAGLACADCHRNGIGHHTVRGFEDEEHPTGLSVATLSCRGCHMDEHTEGGKGNRIGGRFGAPKPLHKGLPPLHFEKLSCTSCHSGPLPKNTAQLMQTSLAHKLGLSEHREENMPPGIVSPVFMRSHDVIGPYRMMWPAFWGTEKGKDITPLNPEDVYDKLRRVLRIRRGETFASSIKKEQEDVELSDEEKAKVLGKERAEIDESKWTEQEKAKLDELLQPRKDEVLREKLAKAFEKLAEEKVGGTPVYVMGGKAYRLAKDGKVETFGHSATKPYAWPLAHDVRPARRSLGAGGCVECHADGAPIFYGTVAALGPVPDSQPPTTTMHQLQRLDPKLLAVWNESFRGRDLFKWFSFIALGAEAILLLLFLLIGINGLLKLVRGKK